jgi:hypothetical protein
MKMIKIVLVAALCIFAQAASATEAYKVLGQLNPSATTATDLYTVPAATSTVISTLVITNQASSPATFRVSIRVAGASAVAKQYLAYDTTVPANDSILMTIGATLATTDVVTVYASTSTVSFNLFGSEIQ